MGARTLETDYLVVGAGAAAMAFVDTLLTESDARAVLVDRRAAPGGHWNDAYPFVRLHQPSMYYGVNSTPLDGEAMVPSDREAGTYGRASGAELRAYYRRVMYERLIPSGRVRFLAEHDHVGDGRAVSRRSGDTVEIAVRKRLVDATYLSPTIPATTPPPFEVGAGASVIPVNELPQVGGWPDRFVVIGAGKTAMDACIWLLDAGVDPGEIQWVKPREAWLINRAYVQPGALVGTLFEGIARQIEAAARATSIDDLFDRLEAADQVRRVDLSVRPTMYKLATVADWEIDLLRRIEDVVRLGRVRAVERDRIVLDGGTVPTSPRHLHVHCAARGLRRPPPLPIFQRERITLQPVRTGLVPFNAAVVAFVEAHRDDDAEKNRLCPPNPFADAPLDWARTALVQLAADRAWSREADVSEWLDRARLNPMRGLRARLGDPAVRAASRRYAESVGPAIARLTELVGRTGG